MVRKRVLTNTAKQASLNAYQQMWQQQQQHYARNPVAASMPEYWHSVCNKFAGAMPRMAVIAPPEVSSRKLSRLRRQLMKVPREAVPMQSFIPNYGLQQHSQVQFQQVYRTAGNRSCLSQGGSKAALLRPGSILAACQNQGFRNVPATATAVGITPTTPQQHHHFNHGNLFDYPATMSPMQWQQQQYQVQQQHKQFLMQQQQKAVPVGILKNSSRFEADHHFGRDLQSPNPSKTKRVTIKNTAARYQEPIVQQLKPEIPPKPNKKMKQNVLKKERQKLQQLQLQHELLKQHQSLQSQKERDKVQHQKEQQQQHLLQHQQDLRKQQQHREAQQQLGQSKNFNFGKWANHFIETSMYTAANSDIKPQASKQVQSCMSKSFSYEKTREDIEKELRASPEKLDLSNREGMTSSSRFLNRQDEKLDSGNESSTITLTTEHEQSKSQYQSRTSLADKATNTKPDPLDDILQRGPQKVLSATSASSRGSRKLNINELLRNEKIKGLEGNPMLHSLMQLVAHMCESRESEKDEREPKSRLPAGSGSNGGQKQYSVYLVVTSDEEDDDGKPSKPKVEPSSSDPKLANNNEIHGEDEYANRCCNTYQAEHPRVGRRRRSRKRLNPRLGNLYTPYPSTQSQLPMRRPLHWPKPDYSKPQGRSNRTRNPTRGRSRSSTKFAVKMLNQRSLNSALDEKQSWRLWEDLPITARALNRAYSRLLTLPGANRSCTEI
ncbi:mediator of RNA polymerase II transcription subunit 15 [Drosophila gunungcola]|uniref:mediator of RNA polymerase II transcription subunit 15 n=1 Tax=Drosophila gunungcola TaxID=103775 RepID=UPI0022E5A4E6|nr:mediator of RNA polymerase II transcription subunit 15 [Drosophila gunungcola]